MNKDYVMPHIFVQRCDVSTLPAPDCIAKCRLSETGSQKQKNAQNLCVVTYVVERGLTILDLFVWVK